MLSSGFLGPKDSGFLYFELPLIFIHICERMQTLEDMRVVEKLARPYPIN